MIPGIAPGLIPALIIRTIPVMAPEVLMSPAQTLWVAEAVVTVPTMVAEALSAAEVPE